MDNLLCAFKMYKHFEDLNAYLKQYFNIVSQVGPVLTFLSLHIAQTKHVTSIDQGEYIYDLLIKYYGSNIKRIKTVTTPMRLDSQFEHELFESLPL